MSARVDTLRYIIIVVGVFCVIGIIFSALYVVFSLLFAVDFILEVSRDDAAGSWYFLSRQWWSWVLWSLGIGISLLSGIVFVALCSVLVSRRESLQKYLGPAALPGLAIRLVVWVISLTITIGSVVFMLLEALVLKDINSAFGWGAFATLIASFFSTGLLTAAAFHSIAKVWTRNLDVKLTGVDDVAINTEEPIKY